MRTPRGVSVLALASLLGGCTCASPGPGGSEGGPIPSASAAAVPIRNFVQVDAGLYRGAQPDAEGFRALRELGVRTVVNLRTSKSDSELAVPAGLDLVEIPVHALIDSDPPTDEELDRFFDVVLDASRRPAFIHCAHGRDRTGALCAVYRIEAQGWTNERALAEMKELGFRTFYGDLEDFVRTYRPRGRAPRK